MKVSFLGLGLMGWPMAKNLIKAGVDLTVWTRTPEKAERFVTEIGGSLAGSPSEAFATCDIAATMLVSGEAVTRTVLDSGAYLNLKQNSCFVDMSSIPPSTAQHLAQMLNGQGVLAVDAPVSGGTKGAEVASLSIFAGGTAEAVERARPALSVLGRVHAMGPPGAGQMTKLANQIIVAGAIGAVAEGLAFAEHGGLDPSTVRDALAGGFADSRILKEHGKRMIDRDFAPGAPNKIFMKDIETILAAARECGADVPFTSLASGIYQTLIEHGGGNLDHSSLFKHLAKDI